MATDLVEINLDNPQPEIIDRAVREIGRGKIVGVPTDALYVLVADPLNLARCGARVCGQGRETVRSLPLAISDVLMAEDLSSELNSRFYILARHFWPGSADDDCAGEREGAAEGDGQHRALGVAQCEIENAEHDD